MPAMDKRSFLNVDDRESVRFALPDCYGKDAWLYLRPWTGHVRSEFEEDWADREAKNNPEQFRWEVISNTLVDEEGELFLDVEKDRGWFMEKNARLIEDLFEAAGKLNGLGTADIEQLAKNSESDPSS